MSKVSLQDLLSQKNSELQEVDNAMISGEYPNAKPIDILRAKRKSIQKDFSEKQSNSNIPYHERKNASAERASFGDSENEGNRNAYMESQINKENPGNEAGLYNRSGEVDENGQSIDSKSTGARTFIDNTKHNAVKGLGDFISGWGDIFQVAGAGIGATLQMGDFSQLMLDGNVLSNAMQEYGGQMAKANENYIPPEVQNPEFSAATFLNPEFWSTHGGQFIPQLTEILATIGTASLIKKGVEKVGGRLLKDVIADNLERVATKELAEGAFEAGVKSGVKNTAKTGSWWKKNIIGDVASTTESQFAGAVGRNQVKGSGSGILGRTFTDQGKMTQGFGDLLQGTTGGAITNLTVSLRNAGEVFNTYKNVYQKDENGNTIMDENGQPKRMFSDQQLGEMAANTFSTNMNYMLADMLSWGMTYGKGWNYLGSFGSKVAGTGINGMTKVAPQLMSKLSMPIFSNVAKWGGKALAEGFEEQIQESYEEWSKMKGYYDNNGSLKGYQGMPLSKDYDMKSGMGPFSAGFYDFLTSKDSEALRAISMGLGAVAGGTFNIKSIVNKQANDVYNLQNRSENLKNIFEKGSDGRSWQDSFIHHQMAELVMEGKGGVFQDFVQQMYNEDKIDDADVVRYAELYNKTQSEYDKIKDLKIAGKKSYMLNTAKELLYQNKIQEATDIYQKNKESLTSILESVPEEDRTKSFVEDTEKKLKKEQDIFRAKITPLANMLNKAKTNKVNLLLDKGASPIDFDVKVQYDENGNADIQYVEKETALPQNETALADEDVVRDEEEDMDPIEYFDRMAKNGWNSVKAFGKKFMKNPGKASMEAISKIMNHADGVEVDENGNAIEQENTQNTEEGNIETKVDGAIQELADSFGSVEDIDNEITNNDIEIRNRNTENGVSISNFDEVFEAGAGRLNFEKNGQKLGFDLFEVVIDKNDKTAQVLNVKKTNRAEGKGQGTEAYIELAKQLEEKGIKLTTGSSDKTTDGRKLWDRLVKNGHAVRINKSYEFISNNTENKNKKQKLQKRNEDLQKAKEYKLNHTKNEQENTQSSQPKFDNKNIIETDEKFGISKKDEKQFKKTGTIGSHVLPYISSKINSDEQLTPSEKEIYDAFKNEIDSIAEQEIKNLESKLSDPDLDDDMKAFIVDMLLSNRKKQLGKNGDVKGLDKKTTLSQDEDWTKEGRAKKEALKKVTDNLKSNFSEGNIKSNLGFISRIFNTAKNAFINRRNPSFGDNEFLMHSQSIQISYALQKMYPNQNMNVYAVQDMYRTVGVPAFGYTLAAQIYIDENNWNQDEVFMHEMSHIYYSLNKSEPETKAIVSYALRNKKLVDKILIDYDDEVQFKLKKSDKDGNEIIASKRDILGNLYDLMTENERDSFFDNQLKEGNLIEIPLADQEVIVDELFAATMEGNLSRNYDKFFNEKVEEEPKRRFLAKKFWSKVKQKGEQFSDKDERKIFFDSLSETDQKSFKDNVGNILESFTKAKLSADISAVGRASKTRELNQEISNKLDDIDDVLADQRNKFLNGMLKTQFMQDHNINVEDLIDTIAFDEIFNTDRLQYANKIGEVVKGFTKLYNKGVSVSNKIKGDKWRSLNYADPERLRYHLIATARQSHSGPDFIRRLQESEFDEVEKFMSWMNKNRDDHYSMLNTLWWHESNTTDITSFRTYINDSGATSLELNLNNRERTLMENVIDRIVQPFNPNSRKANADHQLIYDGLVTSARKIVNGDYTDQDLFNIFKYFTTPEMDIESIWNNDRININGKVHSLKSAIHNFVTSEAGLYGNFGQKTYNGQANFGLKGSDKQIKPAIRTFIKALVNENRKYTANLTTVHADGNQHPSRIVDNYLTRNFKQMKRDSQVMSKEKFYQKHSNINQEGKGARSNNMLDFIYNKLKNGQDIDLIEFGGIENDFNQNKSVTLTDNDSASDRLNQFIIYMKSAGKSSYLMDLGRFSDSSRAYYTEVPKIETDSLVTIDKDGFKFANRAALNNIYNTHKALGYEGSYDEFKNLIEESIRDNVDFIENNISVLKNDTSFNAPISKLIGEDGKLTREGKLKVANFELNNIINGTNFNEIMFPSFKFLAKKYNKDGSIKSEENEALKRAKSGLSPMFSLPNAQVEPIYVQDVTLNKGTDDKFDVTDAGFYILEKHAEKLKTAGGTLMPLGNAFKLLQTGKENHNENFKGQNIYNKGFATILNDEVVSKNPKLKGVYELLKRRDAKYEQEVGNASQNLLDGKNHHFPMIIANSANKNSVNSGVPAGYDLENIMDIELINDMTEMGTTDHIDSLLDKMYWKEKDFVGIDGQNFGVQQVMDIDKDEINSPIQFLKSLTTNMMIHSNSEEIIGILNDIKNLSQNQISRGFEIIDNGDIQEVRDFFKELIDEDKVDQTQKDVLLNDKLSLKTPYLRQLVKNTFANYVKKNGLKLKTPGGILREKPTLIKKAYRTSSDMNATSGNSDLSFYQSNSNGTFSTGEVVIPNRMLDGSNSKKRNKLKARQYFVEGTIEENLQKAKQEARYRGTSVGKVFDEENNHIGYYAAGDTIMATRIPSHGPQSTGFFEIVDFTGEEGNNIQLPNEFKKIIGSDNDGDQVFVQHKGSRTKEWNSIFDRIQKHYLDPKTQKELNQEIKFEKQARESISDVENVYGKRDTSFVLPFSSKGRETAFKDTLVSKGNVGIAADLHTTLRMLASYGVALKKSVTINGNQSSEFFDSEKESITINSAKLFNIILDNSKWGFADKLGINTNTINIAMVLTNLGFSLTDVGMVLNHPVTQAYSELKNRNSGIFNRDEKDSVMGSLTQNKKFNLKEKSKGDIIIDTTKNPSTNNQAIFDLIRFVDSMTSNELKSVGNVLSSHNTMSVNPFEIDELISNFNKTLSNEENNNLIFNEKFKNNPIVENYIATLEKNREIQKKMDPAFNEGVAEVYKNIIEMTGKDLSKKEHEAISNALNLFHTSQLLGLNNLSQDEYNSLTRKDDPRNIYDRLKSHMDSLDKTIVQRNEKNPALSKTSLDTSLLFTKGLNFNFGGNNKYVSVNNEFHQNMIDEELRQQMIKEFNQIPVDLRNDLLLYDLMKNGWAGPNSLFPLFNQAVKMQISTNANIDMKQSSSQLDMLRNRLIRNNPKMFRQYDNVLKFDKNGNFNIDKDLSKNASSLLSSFEKGNPFIFRTQDSKGHVRLVKFSGFDNNELGEIINTRKNSDSLQYYNYLLNKVAGNLYIDFRGPASNTNLSYITIPHINENLPDTSYDALKEVENRIKNGEVDRINELKGREMRGDWYNYHRNLNRDEFDQVQEYPQGFEENRKSELYSKYLFNKQNADKLKTVINDQSVKSMSYEKLIDVYSSEKPLSTILGSKVEDNEKGLGYRDKFAYSEVLRPVVLELAQRDANEQSKLLEKGADKFGVKMKPLGQDISVIQKWLMANDIPSSHPATQAVVKKMETQYKNFLDEKSKYVTEINQVTDELYKEKFGYKVNDRGFIDSIKHLVNQIFSNKEQFYNTLYGPLVVHETIVDSNGNEVKNMRYKTEAEIQEGLKSGEISQAQHNFYQVTKKMTDEMLPFTGAKERQGYIPHTAPSQMEAFSRRGLLGLLVNAKTLDEKIYDVQLNAKNPITGKMVNGVSFKQVEDWYNALSKNSKGTKDSIEFTKLKYKAIDLQRKGINQDGTPIRYSNIEIGTAMGDVFLDRFSKGRSVKSTDFPSLDLNKAFNDYIHSSLFVHGNDNFNGFKRMLPIVDGLLAQLDRDENKNMSEYVEKIWKTYFLQGSKQHNLKNLKALESIGVSSDKVIDYITKGSLVYWLGWKGLAIGGGVYAIGNVLAGKYKNVVNEGGSAWIKGEKRFWLGRNGKFNPLDPLKGWREATEILKTAGFSDINVFDDVGVEDKSGVEKTLMSLALLPMSLTERWIQGVHFLGKLDDAEWENLRTGKKLDNERMAEIENDVKMSHGKGYMPTDQRMIQMYSWGRMMMQFSRWIPTDFYDKFSQEDINRYGDYHVGSYRKVYKTIQKAVDGRWDYKRFKSYYDSLEGAEKRRFDAGLMGFGLTSLLIAGNSAFDWKLGEKLLSDQNIFADFDRMENKLIPPAISMTQNIFR